jgi:integrase
MEGDLVEVLRRALAVAEQDRQTALAVRGRGLENGIGTDGGFHEEDPMYSWIGRKPYRHHARWLVWAKDVTGKRQSKLFDTEAEAADWISRNRRFIVADGRLVGVAIEEYLAFLGTRNKAPMRPQSVVTVGYRLRAIARGQESTPVGRFPWLRAWAAATEGTARATQIGTLAALGGLVAWLGLPAKVLAGCEVTGDVVRGKRQLRIDDARKFIAAAVGDGSPLALAAATQAFCGLRPGEVVELQVRDVDDRGRLLWVAGTKTRAAKREVAVDPAFVPHLVAAASGREPGERLFPWEPADSKDPHKARKDALSRKVRALCAEAGVERVVPHSLRGLNATLRVTGGATDASITRALGHLSIETTRRHYVAPGVVERAAALAAHGRLIEVEKLPGVTEIESA